MKKIVLLLMMIAGLAWGQAAKPGSKAATAHSPAAAKSAAQEKQGAAAGLPSHATVQSFLEHVFGWNPQMKFAIKEIKPSPAPGIAEIVVHADTPNRSGDNSIFVTSGHHFAIAGQMVPFGGSASQKPTNEQIDAFMRQMTASNPGITWTVAELKPDDVANLTGVVVVLSNPQGQRGAQRFWVTPDGGHALLGDVSPFGADPFAAARAELTGAVNGPWTGPTTPKITMVEFGDLECPSCKAAAPVIERLVKEVPGSRLIFQQFPLVTIHHWAYTAAAFSTCVAEKNNDSFWKFADLVFGAQEDISSHVESADPNKKPDLTYAEQKLTQLATDAGMNGKQIAECAAGKPATERVDHSMALGKKMEVTGTPTLFVNGRRVLNITGMPFDQLKQIVEFSGTPQGK
ncbi:MAG: DsbA family protein [Terriglobales bacterium]